MRQTSKIFSLSAAAGTVAFAVILAYPLRSIAASDAFVGISPARSDAAAERHLRDAIHNDARKVANVWVDEGDLGEVLSQSETVRKRDTMADVLRRVGIDASQAQNAVTALRTVYDPRDLRPGQTVRVDYILRDHGSTKRDFVQLTLQATIARDVSVRRHIQAGNYVPAATARPLTRELARDSATIASSLFQSGVNQGVPAEIMFQMIRSFSYDVDFQRDIQPGDSFDLIYDRVLDASGQTVAAGQLRYAEMTLSGTTMRIYRFDPTDGSVDYFNERGASAKKALLRTPIDGAKLTSGFGMRQHPLLGYSLMHRGVDFGAVKGTPIMAAGDGVIERAGPYSGYGNYMRIRHNERYATAYGHMSRFAKGVRVGSRVRQGDIIGFVGATGMATGPHLHYEVLAGDSQINPMSVRLPSGRQLDGAELRRFLAMTQDIDRALQRWPEPAAIAAVASLAGGR